VQPARAPGRTEDALTEELAANYIDATGRERMHAKQKRKMRGVAIGLAHASRRGEGLLIHRTWGQMCSWIGEPVRGMTVDQIHRHHRSNLQRTLCYLEAAGVVASWSGVLNAAGEGTGILIEMVPGATEWILRASRGCSSVGLSVTRERRPSAPASSSRTVLRAASEGGDRFDEKPQSDYALRGTIGGSDSFGGCCSPSRATTTAVRARAARRAAAPLGTRDRAVLQTRVAAALERLRQDLGEGACGASALHAFPWLVDVPADILAREAYRLTDAPLAKSFAPMVWRGPDLRISQRWQSRLLVAASVLERCLGRVEAAERVIDVAIGDWCGDFDDFRIGKPTRTKSASGRSRIVRLMPFTFGGIAVCIRRTARAERRAVRERRRAG
jgi:hypothetical protein